MPRDPLSLIEDLIAQNTASNALLMELYESVEEIIQRLKVLAQQNHDLQREKTAVSRLQRIEKEATDLVSCFSRRDSKGVQSKLRQLQRSLVSPEEGLSDPNNLSDPNKTMKPFGHPGEEGKGK